MKMNTCLNCLLLLASAVTASSVLADTMRCGTFVIQDGGRSGPGKYEVLKKCGEPSLRQGNVWIYDQRGYNHLLTFNSNGLLLTIRDSR